MDPSTVSKLVRRLEMDLGHSLLERTTRSVTLTPQGAAVLVVARRLMAEVQVLSSPLLT